MNLDQLARNSRYPETGTYSELSSEYYDSVKHPTCADFRDAGRLLLYDFVDQGLIRSDGRTIEVGAGRSLVAEVLSARDRSIEGLLITDISFEMLWHSREFSEHGARLLVANALNLPLPRVFQHFFEIPNDYNKGF